MSSKVTYTLEPQRFITGQGYRLCAPHQACRFVIIETKSVPRGRNRHAHQIKRNIRVFTGAGAEAAGAEEVRRLIHNTTPKPRRMGTLWGRSLTRDEYNAVMKERNQ